MSFKVFSNYCLFIGIILIQLISNGCNPAFKYNIRTQLNPYKIAPLTALLHIKAEQPCSVSVTVLGVSPIEREFNFSSKNLRIPVIGLYPNTVNKVLVRLKHEGGVIEETVEIKTNPLPSDFPEIEINKLNRDKMEPGLHACDFHLANFGNYNSTPMYFDDEGVVRWYLDLSFNGKMAGPFQRLKDGKILVAGRHVLYEFDMLGQQVKKTDVDNIYGMHHDVVELPGGQLLIPVGKRNSFIQAGGQKISSDSDFIILYDRKNSKILKEWDLAKHLDVDRPDINHLRKGDWIHINGLAFDSRDSSIIISGKNSGVIKLGWNDELKWIMAPKRNWKNAGRNGKGIDTKPFLLTAVDEKGIPYPNTVQEGTESAKNFDFPWGQHAPKLLSTGNLLLFDNGSVRNFSMKPNYSRAVEYQINDANKTVSQVWQYGKERGTEFFSMIISDADFLPVTKHILVTSGNINPKGKYSAKIVEVDTATGEEVFEATLFYKTKNGNKTFAWGQMDILYRSERFPLKY